MVSKNGKWDINNLEGKGSDEHVVLLITDTILINSSLVIIVNLSSKFTHVGVMESIDPNALLCYTSSVDL